jgi:hypothetical protein
VVVATLSIVLLILLGIFIIKYPEKLYRYHKKISLDRSLFKNYDQLEPNEDLLPTYRLTGILIIIIALIIGVPLFRMIVPNERDADQIIAKSNQVFLDFHTRDEIILNDDQKDEIQELLKDIKVRFDLTFTNEHKKRLSLYKSSLYLELKVSSGHFEFYNEDTAYFKDDQNIYPLKGNIEEVYQYLIGIKNN